MLAWLKLLRWLVRRRLRSAAWFDERPGCCVGVPPGAVSKHLHRHQHVRQSVCAVPNTQLQPCSRLKLSLPTRQRPIPPTTHTNTQPNTQPLKSRPHLCKQFSKARVVCLELLPCVDAAVHVSAHLHSTNTTTSAAVQAPVVNTSHDVATSNKNRACLCCAACRCHSRWRQTSSGSPLPNTLQHS